MSATDLRLLDSMANYAIPENKREEVNKAGRKFADLNESVDVVSNWRAAHAYPLLAFYMTLQSRAKKVHQQALIAQRLKRLYSIRKKLLREENMKLSQMQDIGGCRAILPTIAHVQELEHKYKSSRWGHECLPQKDYISAPKSSGYRSIHLRYRFSGNGNKVPYDGLKIEIQLRTKLQHIWATAVEAADIFTGQALKWSGGQEAWQRFFALMSSLFAIKEKGNPVPGTPGDISAIRQEVMQLDKEHHIVSVFQGFNAITPFIIEKREYAAYFLVTLDPIHQKAIIKLFTENESKKANIEYTEAEQAITTETGKQTVLVSVKSISALKRAYPSYFLDAAAFLKEVVSLLHA